MGFGQRCGLCGRCELRVAWGMTCMSLVGKLYLDLWMWVGCWLGFGGFVHWFRTFVWNWISFCLLSPVMCFCAMGIVLMGGNLFVGWD